MITAGLVTRCFCALPLLVLPAPFAVPAGSPSTDTFPLTGMLPRPSWYALLIASVAKISPPETGHCPRGYTCIPSMGSYTACLHAVNMASYAHSMVSGMHGTMPLTQPTLLKLSTAPFTAFAPADFQHCERKRKMLTTTLQVSYASRHSKVAQLLWHAVTPWLHSVHQSYTSYMRTTHDTLSAISCCKEAASQDFVPRDGLA